MIRKPLPVLIIVVFGWACNGGSPVVFDMPQPSDGKNLNRFPDNICGSYQADDSSSVLVIKDGMVIRSADFTLKVAADSLDSCCRLIGDTLIEKATGEKTGVTVQRASDSIILHLNWADTLFQVSAGHILRSFGHCYLLNEQSDDSTWVVRCLDLRNDILTLKYIPDLAALHYLEEKGIPPADSSGNRLQTSRRPFKKRVRQNGFAEGERFVRIKDQRHT